MAVLSQEDFDTKYRELLDRANDINETLAYYDAQRNRPIDAATGFRPILYGVKLNHSFLNISSLQTSAPYPQDYLSYDINESAFSDFTDRTFDYSNRLHS